MSEIKNILINATRDLIEDQFDVDKITVRQIAYEAHVATGLINYHFGSKWNLIIAAISSIIDDEAAKKFKSFSDNNDDSSKKLRDFLRSMALVVYEYKKYSSYLIKDELFSERFTTPETIIHLLKDIKPELSDFEIRLMAIQIVAPIQYVFLKEASLSEYLKEEISNKETIDLLEIYDYFVEMILKFLKI